MRRDYSALFRIMLEIGNVKIDIPVGIAPMAGVTDKPYRVICRELGAGFGVTELISAKAVLYNNKNTEILLDTCPEEAPCGLQLFGSDPEILGDISEKLKNLPFAWVDLNMGCPVPKVVNNGEGSALMKNPLLVGRIVENMVKKAGKPVTVKIRSGFDDTCINAVEIARVSEEAGATAVAVHARTRARYYSGEADWSVIADVKAALSIPVIGNGDIKSGSDLIRMMRETGCDGGIIGRAARGNPWIFSEAKEAYFAYTEGRDFTQEDCKKLHPTLEERKAMMLRHAKDLIEQKGEFTAVRELRKHFGWYTAGLKHAVEMRRQVNMAESLEMLGKLVDML